MKEENKKMINQEFFTKDEQAILRSLPSPFKWIARDGNGRLFVYEDKPKMFGNEFICRDSNTFTKFASLALFKNIFKGVTFEKSPIRFRDVLDKVEIRYLKSVFSPFRKTVVCVIKQNLDNTGTEQIIAAKVDSGYWMSFPPFYAETMYKGMTVNREYSLAELGIKYD